ncbi:MAG: hypothetical protein R3F02_02985 [Thiolinea sp.]
MPDSFINPPPGDYPANYRLGIIATVAGVILLLAGLALGSGWLTTLLASAGIGLSIGGMAVLRTAYLNQKNARKMRSGGKQ